jgi:hypothetical protein
LRKHAKLYSKGCEKNNMAYIRGDSKNVLVGAAALFVNENGPIPYLGKECENTRAGIETDEDYEYLVNNKLPDPVEGVSYKDTLSCSQIQGDDGSPNQLGSGEGENTCACDASDALAFDPEPLTGCRDNPYRNVGYTTDGIEITFEPDFGEVQVDQVLDTVKLYKQGMKVMLKTSFAEATLENLLYAIAGYKNDLWELGEDASGVDGDPEPKGGRPDNHDGSWWDSTASLDLTSGELGECPVERGLVAVGPGIGECGDTEERIYIAYRALSIESVTVSIKRDEETKFDVTFRLLPEDVTGSYGKIVDRDWRAPVEQGYVLDACGNKV